MYSVNEGYHRTFCNWWYNCGEVMTLHERKGKIRQICKIKFPHTRSVLEKKRIWENKDVFCLFSY